MWQVWILIITLHLVHFSFVPFNSSILNSKIKNRLINFRIINHQPIIFSERVNDPMFVNPKSKIRLFPAEEREKGMERRKKRFLKIKTIHLDEIQISIISFSATSIKTASSHLTDRKKKKREGKKKEKSDKIERAKRKKWREKHFRFTLITFNWNRIHGGKGKTDSNGGGVWRRRGGGGARFWPHWPGSRDFSVTGRWRD